MTENFDIIISGGTLITMAPDGKVIEDAVIGISEGIIHFIGSLPVDVTAVDADEWIDGTGTIILPGLINTHTHLPMNCLRGIADDLPLMEWLTRHIFPVERKFMDRDVVYAGSLLSIAEMIMSGTTTFCDGYYYESSVAQAACDAAIRAVPSQGFIDLPELGSPDQSQNASIAESFIEKWTGVSPLITPALVCHAVYTCSAPTLKTIKDVARHYNVPYQIHLAETRSEVETLKKDSGVTPVRYLDDLGVLDEGTLAAHCVWVDDDDMSILSDRGVKVSHTPESNMKLASGVAPIDAMLKKGVCVSLGTDGSASNNDLDMFGEMGTSAKIHKVATLDPTVLDARTVLSMATYQGARAIRMESAIGSIEVGKCADIIIVDTNQPHMTPCYDPYSLLVYAARGSDVSTVIIGGTIIMKDRTILTFDVTEAMAAVHRIASRIKSDLPH